MDNKQIEEMAKDLCKECSQLFTNCHCISKPCTMCDLVTERLVEKYNYRKIPEGSVVLTEEEFSEFRQTIINLSQEHTKKCDEMNDKIIKARKETAREILTEIQAEIFHYLGVKNIKEADKLSLLGSLITYDLITDKLYEFAKQHGVEIKE